jgi:hypothetical protein
VRAAAAEKRPAVDDQGAPAHRAQVRAAEAAGGAAADEDRVVRPVTVVDEVQDRRGVGSVECVLDGVAPADYVELGNGGPPSWYAGQRTSVPRPARRPSRTKPVSAFVFERARQER